MIFPLLLLTLSTPLVEDFSTDHPLVDTLTEERCEEFKAMYADKKDLRLKNLSLTQKVETLLLEFKDKGRKGPKEKLQQSLLLLQGERKDLEDSTAKLKETIIRNGCPGVNFK